MTYGEDAMLLIPVFTGFFFLACAWFASKNIKGSVMQIVVKYVSFFMALLSILVANANASLEAVFVSAVYGASYPATISQMNNLYAWEIALIIMLGLFLIIFILLAFVEGLANWKNLASKHESDKDKLKGFEPL